MSPAGMEAIVLAGGRGTRLAGVVGAFPKPMADVAGQPFLDRLIRHLAGSGVARVVLATGYRHEVVEDYFGERFAGLPIAYSRETQPLGTGGALRQALEAVSGAQALVLNGDSFCRIDLPAMMQAHLAGGCDVTLGVKAMGSCGRYGAVLLNGNRVIGFAEKSVVGAGCINTGVYCVARDLFAGMGRTGAFSFENDFLGKRVNDLKVCAYRTDGYFIDIGVPEDYLRAQRELVLQMQGPL